MSCNEDNHQEKVEDGVHERANNDALQLAQWEVNGIKTDRPNQLFSSRIGLNPKLKVSKVASGYGETVIPLSLVRLSPKKGAV